MIKHLAVFDKPNLEAVLNGSKKIETRFSKNKIAPYLQINTGDIVYIKAPGEDISGLFRVKKVIFFENLEPEDIEKIFNTWGNHISSGDKKVDLNYIQLKKDATYGTLIFIGGSERFITSPIKYKKRDKRGWVVIG